MMTQLTTVLFLWQEHRPEDGRNTGRNMLVRISWNIKVHVVGYLRIFGSDQGTEGGTY